MEMSLLPELEPNMAEIASGEGVIALPRADKRVVGRCRRSWRKPNHQQQCGQKYDNRAFHGFSSSSRMNAGTSTCRPSGALGPELIYGLLVFGVSPSL